VKKREEVYHFNKEKKKKVGAKNKNI